MWIEFVFHRLSQILCQLPHRSVVRLSRTLAGLLYGVYRLTPHRSFIQNNLKEALDLPPKALSKLSKEHVFQLLLSVGELLRFKLLAQGVSPLELHVEGFDHFQSAHAQNKGVIIVTAHYGFWELLPAVLALQGFPIHVLVQRPSTGAFDRLFYDARQIVGVQTHYNTETKGLKSLQKALKAGECIALVVDQHGESNKLEGLFFGHRVSMPEGPAFFRRLTGAPIVPILTYRNKDHSHVLKCFPALEAPIKPTHQESKKLMQDIYTLFETEIRAQPNAWLWSYNRWDKYTCSPSS